MSQVEIPTIYIPGDEELQVQLSQSIERKMRYVKDLLKDAQRAANGINNLVREIERLEEQAAGYRTELRALHEKLAPLDGSERAALDARYDMLGKIKKARNRLDIFERDVKEAIRDMKESLEK